jgi:hypothetical protein
MPSLPPQSTPPTAETQSVIPGERFLVGLLFLLPVLWFIYPALPHFSRIILGIPNDNVLNIWTFWHATHAFLLHDEPLYSTQRILAPLGSTLALHDMSLLPTFLLSPITQVMGIFFSFNLFLILAQLWAGFGIFSLVRHLTQSRLSAAFAAFLIEMSPILFYRLINHYSLTYIGFIPFLTYLLIKSMEESDAHSARRQGVIIGGTAIACFLTSFNIFTLSFCTLAFLWTGAFITALAQRAHTQARRLVTIVLWAGIVCGAFLYIWAVVSPVQDARFWWNEKTISAGNEVGINLPYLLTPNPRYWAFADHLTTWPATYSNNNDERFCYLGYIPSLLCLIGTVALIRRRRLWGILFLLTLALCINLAIGYGSTPPLNPFYTDQRASPWLLFPKFLHLPLMKQARVPARWMFPALAFFVTFAGCGINTLLQKYHTPRKRIAVVLLLCTLISLEYAHRPTPTTDFTIPAAYQAIGVADTPTAMVVEFPLYAICGVKGWCGDTKSDLPRMAWATQHRYRIVTGYLSRISLHKLTALFNQPFLRDLWMLQNGLSTMLTDQSPTDQAMVHRWLRLNDVRFVIVDKQRANAQKVVQYLTDNHLAVLKKEDAHYGVYQIKMDTTNF